MSTAPLPSLADQPDWEQPGLEVVCPLCEYNLRGLTEPRCPECGYQFVWRELLDPARRVHPYLFEHKRGLAIGAFFKTAWMNLRPGRFWRTLGPQQPSKPRRLIAYWIVVACVAGAGVFGAHGISELRYYLDVNVATSGTIIGLPYGNGMPYRYDWRNLMLYLVMAAVIVAWPCITFLALMVFQISMRRAKVRPIHVLRCVIYSSSAMFWAGLASLAWEAALFASLIALGVGRMAIYEDFGLFLTIPVGLAFTYCLIVAFRRYLRFSHVIATILCSQLIVFLSVMAAFSLAQDAYRWFYGLHGW
ncbi:MAG TPA: hypothetical protein VFC78_04040 [Tepidisphaeraceae bacterium]|nr:hypothetical protein [Tepidisphaeraceae bacterium]